MKTATNLRHADGSRMRRAWVQIHLWLGLTLGVVGALLGLSGSALVYDDAIDEALNPGRYAITGVHYALPFDEYARRGAAALGSGARAVALRLPDLDDGPIVVIGRGGRGGMQRAYLDPGTGRVLDTTPDRDLMSFLHAFHGSLALRDFNGREIVGVVGIAMLISSLSGLYLWWPARGARASLGFRRGRTLSRNLHYTLGFWGMLVLAVLSFSGVVIAFPDAARAVTGSFGNVSPSLRNVRATPGSSAPLITVDDALAVAKGAYPQAEVVGIGLPAGPGGVYRVSLREPDDTLSRPVTVVFVDPRTRAVLHRADRTSQTAGDRFLALQRPLHEGSFGGPVWRALVFAGGIAPSVLMVSGLLMWLATRRRKRSAASRATAVAPAGD